MIRTLKAKLNQHYAEVYTTIKLMDIEEWFDIHFSRFYGLFFAKIAYRWQWTPTNVSVASLVIGMAGGGLLYFQDDWRIILCACVLISLAGVLDSADGQLARMSNQATELGRIIDGLIDNFVFMACYIGAAFYLLNIYGVSLTAFATIAFFTALAGYAHSTKSALYEFYKSEYLFFAGPFKNARIPYPEEIRQTMKRETRLQKIIFYLYVDYTQRQFRLSTRSSEMRRTFEKYAYSPESSPRFVAAYREVNKPLMTWWALICGTNTHRTLIMIFCLLGRFDIYLLACIVGIIPMFIINSMQNRKDRQLLSMVESFKFAAK